VAWRGVVWWVGFRPDPWAWTDWKYGSDDGRFNGRWDDMAGQFRTVYAGESLVACLPEVLGIENTSGRLIEGGIVDPGF
jgi:hypothetical protein